MANLRTLALASMAAFGLASASAAATLQIDGGTAVAWGSGNYKSCGTPPLVTTRCYDPGGDAAGLTNDLQVFGPGSAYPGLVLTEAATLRFTFIGSESAATSEARWAGGGSFNNKTSPVGSFFDVALGAGTVAFDFTSSLRSFAGSSGISSGAGIAFGGLSQDGRSVTAYFDDAGGRQDRDWDDMVVRVEVVPLPASALLLLAGIGGLAAARRLRKAA